MADVEVELLHVAGHHGRGSVRGRLTVPQHHVRRCPGGPASAHQVLPYHPATAHCTEVRYYITWLNESDVLLLRGDETSLVYV